MASKTPTHIWFDGSYRKKGNLGVGWAWKEKGTWRSDNRVVANDLRDDEAHGSHYVELVACFHALKSLPDQSVVIAHTDSQDLIRWMEAGESVFTARKTRERANIAPLRKAFEHALAQKARMRGVTFEYASHKNNEGMKLAHQMAQAASTPDDKEDKKPHAHQNSQRPSSPRNT